MPSPASTPTFKDRKTSTPCTNLHGNPTMRRGLVKPLGEHNRSTRTRPPAPSGSPIASGKRTPATKQSTTVLSTGGVDLSRRFADSMCFNSPTSRTFKSSRVLVDTPLAVKKAITFSSTPRKQQNNSIRKQSSENHGLVMEDHGWLVDMKTPEAQPSKSPAELISKRAMHGWLDMKTPEAPAELSKRAMHGWLDMKTPEAPAELSKRAMHGWLDMKTPEAPAELSKRAMEELSTPSPQPTTSPEFLKLRGGSSVPPSSASAGGCYGAGPLIGMPSSVKDRRKCKPRGILTIEAELLSLHCGEEEEEQQVDQVRDASFVPAMASVEWMVSERPIAVQDSSELHW